jgi:hypothetical protein
MNSKQANQMQWIDLKTAADSVNLSKSTLRTAMRDGDLEYRRSKGDRGKILTTTEWIQQWLLKQYGGQNG